MIKVKSIYNNTRNVQEVDGRLVDVRPDVPGLLQRIKDSLGVLFGLYDALDWKP